MTSFEILLNGEKVALAGLNAEFGVVTAIITCVKRINEEQESITCEVAGLDSQSRDRWEWLKKDLQGMDEVTIKVLPSVNPEPPSVITEEMMRKKLLEDKLKTFYRLREELKDYIIS